MNKSYVCGVAIERMRDRIRLKALETAEACYEIWGVNSFGSSCTTEKTAVPTGLTVKLRSVYQLVGKECCVEGNG